MTAATDVAAYILRECGPMSTWKLQKLVYYAQAWSLVWEDAPLFEDRIEAWRHGPVVRAVYAQHRGDYLATPTDGGSALSKSQGSIVDGVLAYYGKRSGSALSAMTHSEKPWLVARDGLSDDAESSEEITQESMKNYYGSRRGARPMRATPGEFMRRYLEEASPEAHVLFEQLAKLDEESPLSDDS